MLFRKICGDSCFDIVAVNDLSDVENLANLLEYDTVYGNYEKDIKVSNKGGKHFIIGGDKVLVLQEADPAKLPWKKLGVDIVVEATGAFDSFKKASAHLEAGAKRVVITAPAKDGERKDAKTVLMGLNEEEFKNCQITSNGSCTTNATYPVIAVLNKRIGIEKAMLTTVHAYTASQGLLDSITKTKDFRRGRAAAQNIIPSTTGATISVTRVITELTDKFDGMALRVPVPVGSVVDLTFVAKKKTSIKEVNGFLKRAAKDKQWRDILKVTDDPIVSSDVIGQPYGAIVDLNYTKVVDGDLVKVLVWYDNEWGYIATLVKHLEGVAENLERLL